MSQLRKFGVIGSSHEIDSSCQDKFQEEEEERLK